MNIKAYGVCIMVKKKYGEYGYFVFLYRMGWYGLNLFGLEKRPVKGPWEHGNEPFGSMKLKTLE
jgi:hypothetical protein